MQNHRFCLHKQNLRLVILFNRHLPVKRHQVNAAFSVTEVQKQLLRLWRGDIITVFFFAVIKGLTYSVGLYFTTPLIIPSPYFVNASLSSTGMEMDSTYCGICDHVFRTFHTTWTSQKNLFLYQMQKLTSFIAVDSFYTFNCFTLLLCWFSRFSSSDITFTISNTSTLFTSSTKWIIFPSSPKRPACWLNSIFIFCSKSLIRSRSGPTIKEN